MLFRSTFVHRVSPLCLGWEINGQQTVCFEQVFVLFWFLLVLVLSDLVFPFSMSNIATSFCIRVLIGVRRTTHDIPNCKPVSGAPNHGGDSAPKEFTVRARSAHALLHEAQIPAKQKRYCFCYHGRHRGRPATLPLSRAKISHATTCQEQKRVQIHFFVLALDKSPRRNCDRLTGALVAYLR